MTLLHQEYANGTKEKSKCEPFDEMNPCKGNDIDMVICINKLKT